MKKIFRIPSSMKKIHEDIISEICKDNPNYINYFNNIDIGGYYNNKNIDDNNYFYQNLINEYSNKNHNDKKKIILTNKKFKNLIDIIHNKFFGKESNLIIYFKSQGNILYENENENDKYNKYKTQELDINLEKDYDFEDFDNIIIDDEKNANDTVILSVNESNANIIDMSLVDKKNNKSDEEDEEDESETVSKYSDTYSQNINIPENEDDDNNNEFQSGNNLINKSFHENDGSNFKL